MNVAPPRSFADLVGFEFKPSGHHKETHGTTVVMLRYRDGILILADRRATMGNLIMFDQAEKILPLDDRTVVAISGSLARSIEVCRLLKHSFKYYRRMHLQPISLAGKLQEISRALSNNLPMAMNGIGLFLPILAAYDPPADQFHLFFFDSAGASFQNTEFACAGSGSERIRGIFDYVQRTSKPWDQRPLKEVLLEGLRMLDIAADLDSATGGFAKILPAAQVLERTGVRAVDPKMLQEAVDIVLAD